MRLPNFLIIGAAKGGTTSLHSYLSQHPQVFLSRQKELRYFIHQELAHELNGPGDPECGIGHFAASLEEYASHFAQAGDALAVGEATPTYLSSPEAPARIAEALPGVRLIAVLRQPADRAWSAYNHHRRDGHETAGFEEALAQEAARKAAGWSPRWRYVERGYYAGQVRRYQSLFPADRLLWLLYDDLRTDPQGVLARICGFLGVDKSFQADLSRRLNVSGVPKSRLLHSLLTRPHPVKDALAPLIPERVRRRIVDRQVQANLQREEMPAETRARLTEQFRADILELQDLIGRDLGRWLA